MEIEIIGMRSSEEHWFAAQQAPVQNLPLLTEEERAVARSMGSSEESYARRLYAVRLTGPDLARRAEKLAVLVGNWLRENEIDAVLETIRLETLFGVYKLSVRDRAGITQVEIGEDVVDGLFRQGSKDSADAIDRLLAANFGRLFLSAAS